MRTSLTKVSRQSFLHNTQEFFPVFYTHIKYTVFYQQLEKSKVNEHLLPL